MLFTSWHYKSFTFLLNQEESVTTNTVTHYRKLTLGALSAKNTLSERFKTSIN